MTYCYPYPEILLNKSKLAILFEFMFIKSVNIINLKIDNTNL